MNKYTISFTCDKKHVLLNNYDHFDSMFEMFLELLEEAFENKWVVCDAELRYCGISISNDIVNIIKIGTVIANFSIMVSDPNNQGVFMLYPLSTYVVGVREFKIDSEEVKIHIVGNRSNSYNVFPLSIFTCNLKPYFKQWGDMVEKAQQKVQSLMKAAKEHKNVCHDHAINSVLQNDIQPVDTEWMLGYYVRNELKQIKELLETDLQEAKKRISVMEYMINSKVKI